MKTHRHSERCCNDCGAHKPGTCTGCDRRAALEARKAKKVHCLIFETATTVDGYAVVIGSARGSADAVRMLLVDREANGDAFPGERCAEMSEEAYMSAVRCF